jgi:hypothetical protein
VRPLAAIADVDRVETHDGAYVIEAPGALPSRAGSAPHGGAGLGVEELRQESLALEDVFLSSCAAARGPDVRGLSRRSCCSSSARSSSTR